ncbi:hypothetical protein [Gaoshiqia sp. Z1-71]|uniref:hypothetical protein n=1 Tax=Gaoshiqia hydrogeniformans TaxID=3290090 RepID=UPI003BF7DCA6
MNTKRDKIELLKGISAGKIEPSEIPENPLICSQEKEMFIGLMIDGSQENEEDRHVVFVGPAKIALDKFMKEIDENQ